jgi:beta-glucosidase
MSTNLSPDERADLVMKEMTLDEKIGLIHGNGMPMFDPLTPVTAESSRGGGYVIGIPRLGSPAINMCDAAYGVRGSAMNGRYSTAVPADVALAASWDTPGGVWLRRAHRARTAGAGLQHVAGGRRGSHPRSAQRTDI